jgi:hypothetical protein
VERARQVEIPHGRIIIRRLEAGGVHAEGLQEDIAHVIGERHLRDSSYDFCRGEIPHVRVPRTASRWREHTSPAE